MRRYQALGGQQHAVLGACNELDGHAFDTRNKLGAGARSTPVKALVCF